MKKICTRSIYFFVIVTMISCADASNNDIITKHKWQILAVTAEKPVDLNKRGNASTDLVAQGLACVSDDIFIFNENKEFIQDDNKEICTAESVAKKGTWDIINKDSLQINFQQGLSVKYKIQTITPTALILLANMDFIPGGVNVTYAFQPGK